jgi:hypothetical protein
MNETFPTTGKAVRAGTSAAFVVPAKTPRRKRKRSARAVVRWLLKTLRFALEGRNPNRALGRTTQILEWIGSPAHMREGAQ